MTGDYRGFVKSFSKLPLPITNWIQKNNKFEWSEECEQSLQKLKKTPLSFSVLAPQRE